MEKWREFVIGLGSKEVLISGAMLPGFTRGPNAMDLMKSDGFTVLNSREVISTIILTPRDFGYESKPSTKDLLSPRRLHVWSAQNHEKLDDCEVALLPAEAGPYIHTQYLDQKAGEILWIAMSRIVGTDTKKRIFRIELKGDKRHLGTEQASQTLEWDLDARLVFRLRKIS